MGSVVISTFRSVDIRFLIDSCMRPGLKPETFSGTITVNVKTDTDVLVSSRRNIGIYQYGHNSYFINFVLYLGLCTLKWENESGDGVYYILDSLF